MSGPALGLLEVASIARGHVVADALVKKAPVRLVETAAVSPGKYLVVLDGEVADVEEAMAEGARVAGPHLLDRLLLPNADPQLAPALAHQFTVREIDSLAVIELVTASSALRAADAAVKAADVTLVFLRVARGIGGKAYFTLSGALESVEAAVLAATSVAGDGLVVDAQIIARPHPEFLAQLASQP